MDREQERIEESNRHVSMIKAIFEKWIPPDLLPPEWETRFIHIYNDLFPAPIADRPDEKVQIADTFRGWLTSHISDEELCKTLSISKKDWNILIQQKEASWNSYVASLVDDCDYPLCKVKRALNCEPTPQPSVRVSRTTLERQKWLASEKGQTTVKKEQSEKKLFREGATWVLRHPGKTFQDFLAIKSNGNG